MHESGSGTARRLRERNGMSAIGGTAYVAAKLLTRDEARRIAANIAKLRQLATDSQSLASGLLDHLVGACH